jgi:hypothetical protein
MPLAQRASPCIEEALPAIRHTLPLSERAPPVAGTGAWGTCVCVVGSIGRLK